MTKSDSLIPDQPSARLVRRGLWLLPFSFTLTSVAIFLLEPRLFQSSHGMAAVAFIYAIVFVAALIWNRWQRAEDELNHIGKELSSLQSIVNVSRDAIIGVTTDGTIMSWNTGARTIYGYSAREALGSHISLLFDHRASDQATSLFDKVRSGENVTQFETTHLQKGRIPIDVSLTICPIREGKVITGASVVSRDITESKRAAGSLAQQAAAMKASMDGMAIIDRLGACTYLNDAYAKIFDYVDPHTLIGASWEMFFVEEELNRLKTETMPIVWREGSWRGEALGRRKGGSVVPLEISISSVAGGGLVQVVRDITERKHIEKALRDSSLKDELTGLFNRRGLLREAAPHFEFARRQKEKVLLIFIDLDGMKRINDDFGHNEGDNALINTASILSRSFRGKDIVARLGGDEFAVLVVDSSADKDQAIARVNQSLRDYNANETRGYKLSLSIGVATLESERMTCFEELLEQADHAMYEQKRFKKQRMSERNLKNQNDAPQELSESASNLIPFAISTNPQIPTPAGGTFHEAAIGMAVVSIDGSWLQVNESLCKLLGYSEQELRATTFQHLTHPDDLWQVQSHLQRVIDGYIKSHQQEKRYIHEDGHTVWVLWHVSLLKDSHTGSKRMFFQVQDISDRKVAEERLTQDALTGLPNRARFSDFLKLRSTRAKQHEDQQFAVLFLDVDRFKLVNDSLGNHCGDQLLCQIAQRVKGCLRQGDVLGRVGGDEFAVLLDDVTGKEEACSVASRIQQALAISFNLLGQEVYTTMSIGIALSGDYSEQIGDMLRNAETAMHRAKAMGKARYEIFGSDMHGELMSRLKMETDLRHACDRNEFVLNYQPIVSLANRVVIGFEALIRWRHPEFGMISPAEFIPVAEETGQILPIGQAVLESACRQARSWQVKYPTTPLFVSVNLSVKQFNQPGLVENVAKVLDDTKLAPRYLKLEITESVFSENVDAAVDLLSKLRALGVQLSIDDFGTGYSSLSYLQRFPIDTLKIDRSFVTRIVESEENAEIVRTIVTLGQNLGMDVVAEGVESEEQVGLLRQLECENGQGYLFSDPLAADEADRYISSFVMQPPSEAIQQFPALVA